MRLRDDHGQALLLALAFLFFGALVIGAMLSFAYTSASSTYQLEGQRKSVYSADGATDAAIQIGRVETTVGAYGDPRCQATVPTSLPGSPTYLVTTTTNGLTANVICTYSSDPLQPDRTVTFTTFLAGSSAPLVQAQVIYHDGVAGGGIPKVNVNSWVYCGHSTSC